MEAKLRPIPITIFEVLAILVPGFVWFTLFMTAPLVISPIVTTATPPVEAWRRLTIFVSGPQNSWFAPVSLILISLLIGYVWKPHAMIFANRVTRRWLKRKPEYRNIPLGDINFPYTVLFRDKPYYQVVEQQMEKLLGCSPNALYGGQLFTAARGYLRLVAPALADVADQREAEVRMTGLLLLAALSSTVLSLITLITQAWYSATYSAWAGSLFWLIVSVIMSLFLTEGFITLRLREVGYLYTYTLVALGNQITENSQSGLHPMNVDD